MTITTSNPPIVSPVVDQQGKATIPWMNFFKGLFQGDNGTVLPVSPVSITGTALYTGAIYRISSKLSFYRILIEPSGTITFTAGPSKLDISPFKISSYSALMVSTASGLAVGATSTNVFTLNEINLPTYSGTDIVTVCGVAESS